MIAIGIGIAALILAGIIFALMTYANHLTHLHCADEDGAWPTS